MTRISTNTTVTVEIPKPNALFFFFDGIILGKFHDHHRALANVGWSIPFDLSPFQANEEYQFEILSIPLSVDNHPQEDSFERKGTGGSV